MNARSRNGSCADARGSRALGGDALLVAAGLPEFAEDSCSEPADFEWARSGAMALTGLVDGPPLLAPLPLARRARQIVERLQRCVPAAGFAGLDGAALLGERAALLGLRRQGAHAPGGNCRLLRAQDGWIALNLARVDDVGSLPAWFEEAPRSGEEAWDFAVRCVRLRPLGLLVERARWIGLAAAAALAPPSPAPTWCRALRKGVPRASVPPHTLRVVDLSALWAGPLCGELLAVAGAEVIKLEAMGRPDAARESSGVFFDLLNGSKRSVEVDFASHEGRGLLARIVESADVLIESSRPRALEQLGIRADEFLARRPGRIWVSITAWGRDDGDFPRVGFGDDSAVGAGLAVTTGTPEAPLFCGDAIADPLAGLHAALATLVALRCGGGLLLDLALRDGLAALFADSAALRESNVRAALLRGRRGWSVERHGERVRVAAPRARAPQRPARPRGADTAALRAELALRC